MTEVATVFESYAKGPEMDGRTFVKLLKDVKILDAKFPATSADLVFAKVKPKSGRKIKLAEFQEAIGVVAERKGVSKDAIISLILSSQGPEFKGTVADAVKFHDDKSLYTGVHQHGGPSTVDKGRTAISDLSELTDRSSYDIRGVSTNIAKNTS